MDYKSYFKGKKVTVMGLGLSGGALNDAKFLAESGAILTVTDLKTANELKPSLDQLTGYSSITYILGEHRLEDFQEADFIIQPGNVPMDSIYLAEARNHSIPIFVSESLFAYCAEGIQIIGITGTRGKSTVTHLIYEILRDMPLGNARVWLGGNVRNVSTLALLRDIQPGDIVVLELDSWALHGMGDIKQSPHIAVFTTFMNDHMNFYKGNMDHYLHDKAQIFLHQKASDYLVLGEQVKKLVLGTYQETIVSNIITAKNTLPNDWRLKIPGEHNRYNAQLAVEVAKILEIDESSIKQRVENFTGLPGRLEYLGEYSGVIYYNDNNATTPDATIAAVQAFPGHKGKIILIGGGADKELQFTEYASIVPDYVKYFILFTGAATDKIKKTLPVNVLVSEVDSMDKAFEEAKQVAQAGDIVLLSPGAASFGVFKNEYDRNDQFVSKVKQLG